MRIRDATTDDAPRIAEIHTESWRAAYAGLLDAGFLASIDVARRAEGWRRALQEAISARLLVAEVEGSVVGFTHFGPARGIDSEGEIYAMYLDPTMWGRGVGRSLLLAAERHLRTMGFDRAMLFVLDSNRRAIRFYEAAGWAADGGSKTEPMGGRDVTELRFVKRLVR